MCPTRRSMRWPRCQASGRQPRPTGRRARWNGRARRSAPAGSTRPSASTAPASASRSSTPASPPGTTTSGPDASCSSRTSSTSSPQPYDDYGHGTHVAGIIAGSGYDSERRRRGIAPGRILLVLKVLDATATATSATSSPPSTTRSPTRDTVQHPRHQSVGRGRRVRVLQHRPADARGEARRRGRDRRGDRGRQSRPQRRTGAIAVRRDHRAGQRAVGADGWRLEPQRHGRSSRRHVAAFSSRGPSCDRLQRQAGPRRAGRRHRVAGRRRSTLFVTKPAARLWGTVPTATQPYLSLTRHEHGGAGGERHGRADAAGEPDADAESRQGDPAVHGRTARRRYDEPHARRRIPQRARRRGARTRVRRRRAASPRHDRTIRRAGAGTSSGATTGSAAACSWPSANAWHTDVIWGSTTTPTGTT